MLVLKVDKIFEIYVNGFYLNKDNYLIGIY